jgi:hypothetical protein
MDSGEMIKIPGKEIIPHLLPALESHLRQKGWLNKAALHISDEPSLHNALSWIQASTFIHQYAPDLRRMDAVNTHFLSKNIEIEIPMLDNIDILYPQFRETQRNGNELWFYTVGIFQGSNYPNKTIDMPVMDSRLMHWLDYKYSLSGYLHWGWNQWTGDPFKDPGRHLGDAWHVYPAKDGVINSLRWEQVRNGLQDYEYFWLLEQKVKALKDSLGSKFSWIDPTRRGKEIAGRVVMNFAKHTHDPQVLYDAKKAVIKEILDFDKSPRVYIQMNPEENTVLQNRSAVEVFGWAEPGTKIVINKTELPVDADGMFMKIFSLGTKLDKVSVTATSDKGTKEIVHSFVIEQ